MIVDPNAEIAEGFPANVMPQNYGQPLSPKELEDLVQFLIEEPAGGKGGGSKSKGGEPPAAGRRPLTSLRTMGTRLKDRLDISPQRYAQVAVVALGALALIVLTGAGCASPAPASAARTGPSATAARCPRSIPTR